MFFSIAISIHAPRTGSDAHPPACSDCFTSFQSTLPARGATVQHGSFRRQAQISIHAPRTRSDGASLYFRLSFHISIHAPRTGSDGHFHGHPLRLEEFQSTLPARGATDRCKRVGGYRPFQSTLPARGATDVLLDCGGVLRISIHAPRTGSDKLHAMITRSRRHFNPRSPHGERPFIDHLRRVRQWAFQSTLPARGATFQALVPSCAYIISIHAPRTGSDIKRCIRGRKIGQISIHAPRTGSDHPRM